MVMDTNDFLLGGEVLGKLLDNETGLFSLDVMSLYTKPWNIKE